MIPLLDRKRARWLAALLALALVQLGTTVAVAQMLHGTAGGTLGRAAAGALFVFGCEVALRRMAEGLGLDYTASVRDALFRHLMAVEPARLARRRHGAVLQHFVGDLTALRQWVAEGIMRGVIALVALAGLLGWLLAVRPALGGIAAGVVLSACLAGLALMPALHRAVSGVRRARGRVAAFASERLAASATVQACGRVGAEAQRLAHRVERLNRAALSRAWLTGVLRALPHLASTGLVILAVLERRGRVDGSLAGIILVIGIIGLALRDLARAVELAIPGRISWRRVAGLLALPALELPPAGAWVRGETRALVFDDLRLAPQARPITARADKGDVVLLSGDPASRRALLRVVAGLQAPAGGRLRWNGADLAARKASRRRRLVGLVSADLPLLTGSNRFNLRYRAPAADEATIAEMAATWAIDPAGTAAAPHRLALARAMLGRPPVLLLEPDANALSDADISRLGQLVAGWPGVVVLSGTAPWLARLADRQWRLDEQGLTEVPLALAPREHAA